MILHASDIITQSNIEIYVMTSSVSSNSVTKLAITLFLHETFCNFKTYTVDLLFVQCRGLAIENLWFSAFLQGLYDSDTVCYLMGSPSFYEVLYCA